MTTHSMVLRPVPKWCWIDGRATLTTATSRMTMNCATHARASTPPLWICTGRIASAWLVTIGNLSSAGLLRAGASDDGIGPQVDQNWARVKRPVGAADGVGTGKEVEMIHDTKPLMDGARGGDGEAF